MNRDSSGNYDWLHWSAIIIIHLNNRNFDIASPPSKPHNIQRNNGRVKVRSLYKPEKVSCRYAAVAFMLIFVCQSERWELCIGYECNAGVAHANLHEETCKTLRRTGQNYRNRDSLTNIYIAVMRTYIRDRFDRIGVPLCSHRLS